LLVPRTIAVNTCCALGPKIALLGETATWIWDAGCGFNNEVLLVFPELPPHAIRTLASALMITNAAVRWKIENDASGGREKLGVASCKSKGVTSAEFFRIRLRSYSWTLEKADMQGKITEGYILVASRTSRE
jgi:hypothetical protein